MLTTKDNHPNVANQVISEADLKFISENQRLEGFSGEITDAVRNHVPDLAELRQAVEQFQAKIASAESKR
jgi:hypothetical protein